MRVAAYIDGFNLYHAIDELHEPLLKWCDLYALMQSYVHGPDELSHVAFYSAYNSWDAPKRQRHANYVAALRATGVEIELSSFKKSYRRCVEQKRSCKFYEEKRTDVALATTMLSDCYERGIERLILVSADSDQIPAVERIRHRFPENKVHLLAPPNRLSKARELSQACNTFGEMTVGKLRDHVLPHEVRTAAGKLVASCPARYGPIRP